MSRADEGEGATHLDMRKHGLVMAVASLASQGVRDGAGNGEGLAPYVLDALQCITITEIRDMLRIVIGAQNEAKAAPVEARTDVFAKSLIARCQR